MGYIDADNLKGLCEIMDDKSPSPMWKQFQVMIDSVPAIDAEPVVRCKDCRWGKEACGNIECFVDLNAPTEYHGYEWYCPNGERK